MENILTTIWWLSYLDFLSWARVNVCIFVSAQCFNWFRYFLWSPCFLLKGLLSFSDEWMLIYVMRFWPKIGSSWPESWEIPLVIYHCQDNCSLRSHYDSPICRWVELFFCLNKVRSEATCSACNILEKSIQVAFFMHLQSSNYIKLKIILLKSFQFRFVILWFDLEDFLMISLFCLIYISSNVHQENYHVN